MPRFEPANPDFRTRTTDDVARQAVMGTLNVQIEAIDPGHVIFSMPFNTAFSQQHGFLHAGTIATVLDSACGYAAFSLMPADAEVLTIEFKLNLLAPARGARFLFRGDVVKPGRTITVAEGRAFADPGEGQKLIASMTATLMTVRDRPGIGSAART